MRELLKLYVSSKKTISKAQYDYIINDDELLLNCLAAGNKHHIDFKRIKEFVNSLNKNKLKYLLKRNVECIKYINNPSEDVQLAAVKQDGSVIAYILSKDIIPSEDVQLAAVQQNSKVIEWIFNFGIIPSEQVQLAAVKQNGLSIIYIYKPSESVQLAAVKQNGYIIQYINNPSETVQLAAVKQNELAIKYIENPYPSVLNYVKSLKK